MLIRLKTGLSGPAFALGPGDEREFPDDEAVRLIEAGFAVPAQSQPPIEHAVQALPAETRGARKRKAKS